MIAAMLNRKLGGQGETKKARLFKQRKMEVLENGSKQAIDNRQIQMFLKPLLDHQSHGLSGERNYIFARLRRG